MIVKELVYDPHKGEAIPDGNIDSRLTEFIYSDYERWYVSTENIVNLVRVSIKENIYPDYVFRIFFRKDNIDTYVPYDEDGRSDFWPSGFLDTTERLLMRLL